MLRPRSGCRRAPPRYGWVRVLGDLGGRLFTAALGQDLPSRYASEDRDRKRPPPNRHRGRPLAVATGVLGPVLPWPAKRLARSRYSRGCRPDRPPTGIAPRASSPGSGGWSARGPPAPRARGGEVGGSSLRIATMISAAGVAIEGPVARHHFVEHAAQREDVRARVRLLPATCSGAM